MTPEQLQQIEQARRYAEQDEYVVTRTHIGNLLAIIEGRAASVSTTITTPDWLESEYPNGMTQQDVHNELHDYEIMLDNVPSVYEHVTGGNTSNPMVLAPTVIALADEWANQSYQDGVSDTRDELVPDEIRDNIPRARELADRLVASGPKCCAVSASETHEISDFIRSVCDLLEV